MGFATGNLPEPALCTSGLADTPHHTCKQDTQRSTQAHAPSPKQAVRAACTISAGAASKSCIPTPGGAQVHPLATRRTTGRPVRATIPTRRCRPGVVSSLLMPAQDTRHKRPQEATTTPPPASLRQRWAAVAAVQLHVGDGRPIRHTSAPAIPRCKARCWKALQGQKSQAPGQRHDHLSAPYHAGTPQNPAGAQPSSLYLARAPPLPPYPHRYTRQTTRNQHAQPHPAPWTTLTPGPLGPPLIIH
jgi:hypothetical protein